VAWIVPSGGPPGGFLMAGRGVPQIPYLFVVVVYREEDMK